MALINKLRFRKRSRFTKRMLGFLAIFTLSGIFLQGNVGLEEAHAQVGGADVTSTDAISSIDQMGLVDIFDLVLKVIYILLWPLLVIAGWSLDNTLVYGSIFHMDAPLWKFRNMMKNFANFALGFIVLFSILQSIFKNTGAGSFKEEKSPLGIIKKTLIAGVLIQASRFLMAAVIDLSTVATYAVGGLPLSIIQNTDLGDKKILAVNSELDLNKFSNFTTEGDYYKVRYETKNKSGTQILLSDCKIQSGYVIGRKDGDVKFRNAGIFSTAAGSTKNACVLFGNQVVLFNEFGEPATEIDNANYQNDLNRILGTSSSSPINQDWKLWEACGLIVRINGISDGLEQCGTSFPAIKTAYTTNNPGVTDTVSLDLDLTPPPVADRTGFGLAAGTIWFQDETDSITISSLISKSKGFVGPLVTMYASMLNFAQMVDVQPDSLGRVSGEMMIKAAFAIAIFIPLLALAVVLILRIGFLWMVIAASPFLVLKESFKETFGKLGGDTLKLGNILGVVFAPVVTVFALSISLIFMTTLIKSYSPSTDGTTTQSVLFKDMEAVKPSHGGDQAYKIIGANTIEFKNLTRGGTLDRFSRLIVNFVAVGFVWVLLFAAIKANSLGKWAGEPIQKFGQGLMGTLPIVPVPAALGGGRIGLSTAAGSVRRIGGTEDESGSLLNYEKNKQTRQVEKWSNTTFGEPTTTATLNATQAGVVIEALKAPNTTTTNAAAAVTTSITAQNLTGTATEYGANSGAELYAAINKLGPTEITTIIPIANAAFGAAGTTDWYKNLATKDVKTNVVDGLTATSTQQDIDTKIGTPTAKNALDAYFGYVIPTPTNYSSLVGDGTKTLTITRTVVGTTNAYTGALT